MNKKILLKVIMIVFVLLFTVYPHYTKAITLSDIITGGDTFLKKDNKNEKDVFDEKNEREAVDQLYYILIGIAILVAIVTGMVLGIQFITSGAAGQAKVKEKLIPYILGLFVAFGAFGIWRIALNLGRTLLEAPPAYLMSTDVVSVVMVSKGDNDRKNEIGYSGNPEDVTVNERQRLGIYIANAESMSLPIARGRVKIKLSNKMEKSSDTDRWVGVGPIVGHSTLEVDASSVSGKNGYNAWYDASTSEIVFEYSDLNNVPAVGSGEQLVSFEIKISEEFQLPDDSLPEFSLSDKNTTMGYGTYNVTMSGMKYYDVENNDITKNVASEKSNYELKIKYWIDTESWGEVWRDGAPGFLSWIPIGK